LSHCLQAFLPGPIPAAMMVRAVFTTVLLVLVAPSAGRSDYGYTSQDGCIPGYDQDCATPMTLTGSSIAHAVPQQSPDRLPSSEKDERELDISVKQHEMSTNENEECELDIPNDCKFPFTYKHHQYSTCTDVDVSGTKWCSAHKDFEGKWRECKKTCKHKWPMKSIIGTAVTGAVVVAGAGIAAGVTELMQHKKGGTDVAVAETTPMAASVPTTSAEVAASRLTPGVQVTPLPSAVPAVAARFLDKQAPNVEPAAAYVAPETVSTSPTQHKQALVGFAVEYQALIGFAVLASAVFCVVCMCAIVATGVAFRKKRGNVPESESESE